MVRLANSSMEMSDGQDCTLTLEIVGNPCELTLIRIQAEADCKRACHEAWKKLLYPFKPAKPVRVVYHPPATVIYWDDGTRTVVKCMAGTTYDEYNGFCAAVTRKYFGSPVEVRKAIAVKETKTEKKEGTK